jgi:hypothetical protein
MGMRRHVEDVVIAECGGCSSGGGREEQRGLGGVGPLRHKKRRKIICTMLNLWGIVYTVEVGGLRVERSTTLAWCRL